MTLRLVDFAVLAGVGVAFGIASAAPRVHAHDAPAGWAYDAMCCSGNDCYEVSDSEIEITAQGYVIRATKEVVPFSGGGQALDGGIITLRPSKDEHFHRCSRQSGNRTAPTICLYSPPMGT